MALIKGQVIKQNRVSFVPLDRSPEQRLDRIVSAALEAFSESSFRDATTDEIARRASVSKRDIYAAFPTKHAILIAVINKVLQADDENLTNVISLTKDSPSFRERLEVIGLALINEILSPATGFVARLIAAESVSQPQIGAIYFENWYSRRTDLMSQVFAQQLTGSGKTRRFQDTRQAAKHYVALITHLPQLTASIGMRDIWNSKSIQTHTKSAVECFVAAHQSFA